MLCNSCGNVLESFNKFCPKCGAPAPAQYQPPSPSPGSSPSNSPQTPGEWGPMSPPPRKSSCGKVLLIVGIILLLLGGGVGAAFYFGYQKLESTLKSSEPYTVAINRLKESEEVRNELGEITETGFPLGAYHQNSDGTGDAGFAMSVQGSKAGGRYEVHLARKNSIWRLMSGVVRTDTGKTIDVDGDDREDEVTNNDNTNDSDNINAPGPEKTTSGKPISGGVLNAKATSLPQPTYPPAAKAVKASGSVVVQVVVDEKGNVISASAISGHPLLRAAAVVAARQAKFTPTKLAGKPVKVSGILNYNFVAE
jgi:TonB family protein